MKRSAAVETTEILATHAYLTTIAVSSNSYLLAAGDLITSNVSRQSYVSAKTYFEASTITVIAGDMVAKTH